MPNEVAAALVVATGFVVSSGIVAHPVWNAIHGGDVRCPGCRPGRCLQNAPALVYNRDDEVIRTL